MLVLFDTGQIKDFNTFALMHLFLSLRAHLTSNIDVLFRNLHQYEFIDISIRQDALI